MKTPLRIAVLECDTPVDRIHKERGSYGDIFENLLKIAAKELKSPDLDPEKDLQVTKFHVQEKKEYPKIDDIDAILISGSKFNSFDNDPWIIKLVHFTQKILNQNRVRIIGVCFGHQIVGRAMGVKVDRSDYEPFKGWETSVYAINLTPKGEEVFGKQGTLNIHQMHRDIVYAFPNGVEPIGSTTGCTNQGMYAKGRLITVQGHPEFDEDIMRELCETRHTQGIFNEELYNDSMRRVAEKHDGVIIAQAFLRFLLED